MLNDDAKISINLTQAPLNIKNSSVSVKRRGVSMFGLELVFLLDRSQLGEENRSWLVKL